ncbi:MAG TPA: hypothetical protein VKA63_00810, partial [Candidatus Krumholzibacteria bacterium]|nr:hypothetical protein [Candidatus Krumholzibacteria bacterium]
MRGLVSKILFALLVVFTLQGNCLAQDDGGVLIDLHRQGARRVRLRMLPLSIESTQASVSPAANALANRLVRDFVYSGVLDLIDPLPEGVRRPASSPPPTVKDEKQPDAVVALGLSGEDPASMILTARLLAPGAQTLIVGKRYVVDLKDPGA